MVRLNTTLIYPLPTKAGLNQLRLLSAHRKRGCKFGLCRDLRDPKYL